MKVRILQFKNNSENRDIRFLSYETVSAHGLTVTASRYEEVYGGEVDAETLEDVYSIFNINRPLGFIGHSLSVSDVIEVQGDGFYYIDTFGFKKLDNFDIKETDREKLINILICENNRRPYRAEIRHELEALQNIVGGLIEPTWIADKVLSYHNEEFLFNGSEPNRVVNNTVIHGTFLIAGAKGEREISLTEEQMQRYEREYYNYLVPSDVPRHYHYV